MQHTLLDLVDSNTCNVIFCDNTAAKSLSENPVHHSRSKHIDVRYHFLRDNVAKGTVMIDYVQTEDQIADIFTKPLDAERFRKLRFCLGLVNVPQ